MTQPDDIVPVQRNEDREQVVPSAWRPTIAAIVAAFRDGDFALERGIADVSLRASIDGAWLSDNVAAYGGTLDTLPPETWWTSVYVWMGEWWEVLVDLFTVEEGRSDLVLFLRVRERASKYEFEVTSLHVP